MNFDTLIFTALYSKALTLITYEESEAVSCRRHGGTAEHSSGATAASATEKRVAASWASLLCRFVDFLILERLDTLFQIVIFFPKINFWKNMQSN